MVELDGYAVHGTRNKFETDRRRDELLVSEGIRVVRITWLRLKADPRDVVRSLTSLLAV